jgi:nucleoside-diphosphate-sugar epimerase
MTSSPFPPNGLIVRSILSERSALAQQRDLVLTDIRVFQAHARGHILAYVVSPAAIYGPGQGPVRKTSMGLHLLVQLTMKHGGSPVINSGTAVWADVHIADVVDLYVRIFRKAIQEASAPATSSSRTSSSDSAALPDWAFERYYFAVGHEMTWASWARSIARVMISKGKLDSKATEPVSVTLEQEPYMWWAATNVRPVAKRAKLELGWQASHPSFEDTLPTELDSLLAPMVF